MSDQRALDPGVRELLHSDEPSQRVRSISICDLPGKVNAVKCKNSQTIPH